MRREIRDPRAKDPLIGVTALQDKLEKKFNRTFTQKYVAKFASEVEFPCSKPIFAAPVMAAATAINNASIQFSFPGFC